MNRAQIGACRAHRTDAGFTLVEAVIGLGILGLCVAALSAGLTFNVSTVKYGRETIRATQIMEEKLDTIRLYTWDRINTPGYITSPFYVRFFPTNAFSSQALGVTYTGTVTIATAPLTGAYKSNLVKITVDLYWPSKPQVRHAQMSTFVGKYGLQSYVY